MSVFKYINIRPQNMESVMANQTSPKAFGPPPKKATNGKFRAVEKNTEKLSKEAIGKREGEPEPRYKSPGVRRWVRKESDLEYTV